MENSKIKDIDQQVETLVNNIGALQKEIETYHQGHRAFVTATNALTKIADSNKQLADKLGGTAENLEKIDSVAVLQKVEATASEISKIKGELDLTIDRLANLAIDFLKNAKELSAASKSAQESQAKLLATTEQKVTRLFSDFEKRLSDSANSFDERFAKLAKDAELKLTRISEENHRSIETLKNDIIAQNQTTSDAVNAIQAQLDNGIKVKKRFF